MLFTANTSAWVVPTVVSTSPPAPLQSQTPPVPLQMTRSCPTGASAVNLPVASVIERFGTTKSPPTLAVSLPATSSAARHIIPDIGVLVPSSSTRPSIVARDRAVSVTVAVALERTSTATESICTPLTIAWT